jgi:hypothetical protein
MKRPCYYFTFLLLFTASEANFPFSRLSTSITNASLSWNENDANCSLIFLATHALYKQPAVHLCKTKTSTTTTHSVFYALPSSLVKHFMQISNNDVRCFIRKKAIRENDFTTLITAIEESLLKENDSISKPLKDFFLHVYREQKKIKQDSSRLKKIHHAKSQHSKQIDSIDFGHHGNRY